ncbi:hypothetical protein PN451_15835 [Dolichospermum planctonicum CS-1226]|uniref:Cyanobacterial TRADD-N associated 2 transmembrane domain-containing protein n=1 Tax=Dolichospermum planctonicum CS-1226 TaxID=3021751 RepID=A0ABT5AK71_9CYAN|nr:hypothetical protein [Dolichospermum planctonicum]MDB9537279.1 hypothetical protein [Dolichospermum planctonicum CS-1226]
MFNLFNKSQPQNYQITEEQRNQIVSELTRQYRVEHNVTTSIATTSAILTFVSIILLYTGQIQQTHLNIGMGVISSLVGFKSANKSKKELKELLEKCQILDSKK